MRDPATGATREIVVDSNYVRESILDPNALLADGFAENLMPPLGAARDEAQVDALVKFILYAGAPK